MAGTYLDLTLASAGYLHTCRTQVCTPVHSDHQCNPQWQCCVQMCLHAQKVLDMHMLYLSGVLQISSSKNTVSGSLQLVESSPSIGSPGRASCICFCRAPIDQVAQQESPIPCHITTGRDVELNDRSFLLGRGLYGSGSERGVVTPKTTSSKAKIDTRVSTSLRRFLGLTWAGAGPRSTWEASTLTSSAMRVYLAADIIHYA